MHMNLRTWLASSVALHLAATACSTGPSAGEDPGHGGGDGGVTGRDAAVADAGTGGGVDAATSRDSAVQDAPTQADVSVPDSGMGTSDGGDEGPPGSATDGGPAPGTDGGTTHGKQLVVWNGEDVSPPCSHWANPGTDCSTAAQNAVSHSPPTAVQFTFDDPAAGGMWLGGGWDWVNGAVGPNGTDITSMKNFTFWLRTEGQVAGLSFNLLCNGAPALDQPQHHTAKVEVSTYEPQWNDGSWHRISVPLSDLAQPAGFDPQHVAELQFFNTGPGNGSFFFDDLAFDDGL
jgi:hypothetical protein